MLPISRVITSMVYYNSLVRDTLEYTMNREDYQVEFYNYKKYGVVNEVLLNTPLKSFLDSNGEKGDELRKKLVSFGEEVYGDKSTILKVNDKTIKVDHAQDVKLFDLIVPIHEELNAVIKLHFNFLVEKKNDIINSLTAPKGEFEGNAKGAEEYYAKNLENISKLLEADENFYRSVAFQTLALSIFNKFNEFNKTMRESNGQKTPAASFIETELQSLLRNFYIVAQNASTKNELFTKAKDCINNSIEMMTNKRSLPAGKNFNDVFAEARSATTEFIMVSEEEWKKIYGPAANEMKADLDKLQAAKEEAK